MTDDLQKLGVVGRLFPLILSGQKTSSWRETPITRGYMRYVCDDDPAQTCVVWVTRCTDMPLSRAAAFLGREAEWPRDFMLAGMREHYPSIRWNDAVQVVEHLTARESSERPDFPG